jgi:rhodanese-related sulfurtransferase
VPGNRSNRSEVRCPKLSPVTRLGWDGCRNARDVGGLPTRSGRTTRAGTLIRTDSLDRLSPAGRSALTAAGAGLVLDLRSDWELEEEHPLDGDPAYVRIPWIDPEADLLRDPDETRIARIYRGSLDRNVVQIAAAYRAISAAPLDAPVVVHCRSGKDRTGLLVAILLDLIGVPRDVIAADYALSEVLLEITDRPVDLRTPPEAVLESLDHLDRAYGGSRAYLVRIGLTDTEIGRLTARLAGFGIEAVVFDRWAADGHRDDDARELAGRVAAPRAEFSFDGFWPRHGVHRAPGSVG